MTDPAALSDFIRVWQNSGGAERANYQLFLTQLCHRLGVPEPQPTVEDPAQNAYVFERDVTFAYADGSTSIGRIDLYKRGCFVLEAKQGVSYMRKSPSFRAVPAKSSGVGSIRSPGH